MKVTIWLDRGTMIIKGTPREPIRVRGVEEMKLNFAYMMVDSYEEKEDFWAGHALYADISQREFDAMARAARR